MPGTAKHSISHQTVMKAAVLILAASVVAVTPLLAKAQTFAPSPAMPQTAPSYADLQSAPAQGAYPYWSYPYWAYAYPWDWGYPWGWGWPVGVSIAFGGCLNCGSRGAFFHRGFAHPAFFRPGFGRFGFAHPGFFHSGFGRFGFAHAGFGGGFHGGGRR